MFARTFSDGASGIATVGDCVPCCGGGTNLLTGAALRQRRRARRRHRSTSGRGVMLATLNSVLSGFLLGSFWVSDGRWSNQRRDHDATFRA